ncbi:zinc-binding dehydrogenase [Salinibacillus aidingensis]|uniref:zinc-binding dehydrogenase n=1 Tax=Salinibacillus aidingensis TaxID=237684 RepID=UPI003CD06711
MYNRANCTRPRSYGWCRSYCNPARKARRCRGIYFGITEKKLNIGKRLGANATINYKEMPIEEYVEEYTDGKGFDIVFRKSGSIVQGRWHLWNCTMDCCTFSA